jgi:hypothetical protein
MFRKMGRRVQVVLKAFNKNAWGAQLLFYSKVYLATLGGPCNAPSALGEPAPTLVGW